MSVKNVKAFFEKVEGDKGLQGKLKTSAEKYKAQEDVAMADLVKIAAEAGFKFTASDCAEARKQVVEELSEDELKAVAGKGNCPGGAGYKCGVLIRF